MARSHLENVDLTLRKFAEGLKAHEEYSKEGNELCQQVVRLIQENVDYVASKKTGGSIGKRTDVINPDYDIVINVNGHVPLFEQVLDDFETLLKKNRRVLKIAPYTLRKTRFSISFQFTNGIKVDLVPAAYDLTRDQVFAIMSKDPSKVHMYSSCLMEDVVDFMRKQSGFAHSIARIGKTWYKTLYLGAYVSGGSTIMELISVAAAMEEEEKTEKGMMRALEHFMDMIQQLDSLKLVFRKIGDEWTVVPQPEMHAVVGNKNILKRRYFIVEPANPYNDLLYGVSPAVIEKLKKFAGVTRKRLQDLRDGGAIKLEVLFEPQPSNLTGEFSSGIPINFLIRYNVLYSSVHCGKTVHRDEPMQRPEVSDVIEVMKRNLLITVNALVAGTAKDGSVKDIATSFGNMNVNSSAGGRTNATTVNDIVIAVDNIIGKNFDKKIVRSIDDKKDEDYDVTISIPYRLEGIGYAVVFSMKWK